MEDIEFPAQVTKVQTLADGGIRVTLDLPESAIFEAAQLMECKRCGVAGKITFSPMVRDDDPSGTGQPRNLEDGA